MLWWEEHRFLAVAVSGSVALHGAALAIVPGPQSASPPAPLIVRVEVSPASQPALRESHASAPVQQVPVHRPQRPAPQATAPLPRQVDETPPRPTEETPATETLASHDPPPPEVAERPVAVQVALAATTAAPPAEKHAALDTGALPEGVRTSNQSDQSPVAYLFNPAPDYPLEARRLHQQGDVIVHVRVDPSGQPREATIARSSGVPLLDEAALTGVRAWRFSPAKDGNTPVEHWVAIPISFKLDARRLE